MFSAFVCLLLSNLTYLKKLLRNIIGLVLIVLRTSLETQGFNGGGDGKESGSEKNEEEEGGGAPPPFLVFLAPVSFPSPFPLKPWVSEDVLKTISTNSIIFRNNFFQIGQIPGVFSHRNLNWLLAQ